MLYLASLIYLLSSFLTYLFFGKVLFKVDPQLAIIIVGLLTVNYISKVIINLKIEGEKK